jgi:dipeptidyl aminopeptidase/acylaminoacyl peptidase
MHKYSVYAVFVVGIMLLQAACTDALITPVDPNTSVLLTEVRENLAGYKIAYGTETSIMMMDADGTNAEELTDASPISGYVSWSPDAKYVYYASAKGPAETAWEAWRVDVETKAATQLSNFGRDVRSLGVSPDNGYLAISLMTGNSNIGNNNNNLTQFTTNLYIVDMFTVEQILAEGERLQLTDLELLLASPPADQFWYEELSWNPVLPANGIPILAYTKTWRYDEDFVSYTHTYTINADGTNNTLIAENQHMPIWDFTGTKLVFLSLGVYDIPTQTLQNLKISGIPREVAGASISPDGHYIVFEVGDRNRQGGMARYDTDNTTPGEVLQAQNVFEPRWSPQPVE